MIKIIGTTHLDSKESIEKIIEVEKPEVLGVELCELRAKIFLENLEPKKGEQVEEKNLLQKITNSIKRKAEKENLDYGADMKTALRYGVNNNIPVVLVDMPILKIQELFAKIPKEEQEGFTRDLMEFENKPEIEKEVNEEEVLDNLKTKYPVAFEFLVNMRNIYIANQILKVQRDNHNKKILIFLGKAHLKNVELMIK